MSTIGLICGQRASANAATRYSDAGLLRPDGLKLTPATPWRSKSRTACFVASSCVGARGDGAIAGAGGRDVKSRAEKHAEIQQRMGYGPDSELHAYIPRSTLHSVAYDRSACGE
jgi:hypothetical protein